MGQVLNVVLRRTSSAQGAITYMLVTHRKGRYYLFWWEFLVVINYMQT